MSGHTPEPWTLDDGPYSDHSHPTRCWGHAVRANRYGEWVATGRGETQYEANANAVLIAAAPELLAVLREIVGHEYSLIDDHSIGPDEAWDMTLRARAAIAKAEGR